MTRMSLWFLDLEYKSILHIIRPSIFLLAFPFRDGGSCSLSPATSRWENRHTLDRSVHHKGTKRLTRDITLYSNFNVQGQTCMVLVCGGNPEKTCVYIGRINSTQRPGGDSSICSLSGDSSNNYTTLVHMCFRNRIIIGT